MSNENKCNHTYSRSMTQTYPRKCVLCGKEEMKELDKLLKNIENGKVDNFETELLNSVIVLNNRVLKLENTLERLSKKGSFK